MARTDRSNRTPEVTWQTQHKTLTLTGEPVLEYQLQWPQVEQAGLVGRWISAYYRRMAASWEARWEKEVYCRACLDLAQRRAGSRPFRLWTGALSGQLTLQTQQLLSFRFDGQEQNGDGTLSRVSWGDTWELNTGAPFSLKRLLGKREGGRRAIAEKIVAQGQEQAALGSRFFLSGWEKGIRTYLPLRDFWLTDEEIHFSFPQCTISPAAEGTPDFSLPYSLS